MKNERRVWFYRPQWYWHGWKTFLPFMLGHDEYAHRVLVFGWTITGRMLIAAWEHLHRGDPLDTVLDESHEAKPSGMRATLATWKAYGPLAMRQRFDDYDSMQSPHVLVTDDGDATVITVQNNWRELLDALRENFAQHDQVQDDDLLEFVTGQGVIVYIESI